MSRAPSHAIVLTGPPGGGVIDDAAVAALRDAFPDPVAREQWLCPGDAWEVLAPAGEPVVVRATAAAALARYPIDVNMVPADSFRRKRLLVADMESTIIQQECLDELGAFAGVQHQISGITARAMRGELDFEAALKERVGLLKGLDASLLQRVYDQVTLMPGAETLVSTMRAGGATCALVSGGFTFFTERIATRLGFDRHRANTLEVSDARLAGTVASPILGREAKLQTLRELAGANGLQAAETLAVGDGANDLAMIEAAGLGVAFRAKPILAQRAAASIVHSDLTALLYLQGFRHHEFAVGR